MQSKLRQSQSRSVMGMDTKDECREYVEMNEYSKRVDHVV